MLVLTRVEIRHWQGLNIWINSTVNDGYICIPCHNRNAGIASDGDIFTVSSQSSLFDCRFVLCIHFDICMNLQCSLIASITLLGQKPPPVWGLDPFRSRATSQVASCYDLVVSWLIISVVSGSHVALGPSWDKDLYWLGSMQFSCDPSLASFRFRGCLSCLL